MTDDGRAGGKRRRREMNGENKMTTEIERWRSFYPCVCSSLILLYHSLSVYHSKAFPLFSQQIFISLSPLTVPFTFLLCFFLFNHSYNLSSNIFCHIQLKYILEGMYSVLIIRLCGASCSSGTNSNTESTADKTIWGSAFGPRTLQHADLGNRG